MLILLVVAGLPDTNNNELEGDIPFWVRLEVIGGDIIIEWRM